jgi:hypothetical protein
MYLHLRLQGTSIAATSTALGSSGYCSRAVGATQVHVLQGIHGRRARARTELWIKLDVEHFGSCPGIAKKVLSLA